jgi:hypothetical protein
MPSRLRSDPALRWLGWNVERRLARKVRGPGQELSMPIDFPNLGISRELIILGVAMLPGRTQD